MINNIHMSSKPEKLENKPSEYLKVDETIKLVQLPESASLPIVKDTQEKTEWVKLELISNPDFLNAYPKIADRFSKLTNPSLNEQDIENWDKIHITFTHNGVFNKSLYLNTTAGQCLPAKIRSVEVNWERFTRLHNSISWEFYNSQNKRLTIHEGTKLGIQKCISHAEVSNLEKIETHFQWIEREIYTFAIRKWIDPDILKLVAKDNIINIDDASKRSIELELYATEISRGLSRESFIPWEKYSLNLSAKILKNMLPAGWESKLKEYWYGQSEITEYVENNYFARNIFGLGSLSAEYESGSRWVYAYNPDDNNTWYPSYWTYQMHRDSFNDFCEKHDIEPRNKEGWDNAVKLFGIKEFQAREYQFIKETHYDAMMNQISLRWASQFSNVLKNVIWSTAVQHGPNKSSIISLINNFSEFTPGDIASETELINLIYEKRMSIYPEGASRYKDELRTALKQLNNSLPYELSSPIEISDSWTTLCSKTARLNLEKLWIEVHQWASAFDSMRMYDEQELSSIQHIPADANVIDIFSAALNPNNHSYWHRSAAYKMNWEWFVLDPYTRFPSRVWWTHEQRRKPIPLAEFMQIRNIHAVVYHSVSPTKNSNDLYS